MPADGAAPATPSYVCFAGEDWWYHNQAHADFQIMLEVARSRRVLVVNSIGMRMPSPGKTNNTWGRIKRKVRSMLRFLQRPVPDRPQFAVFSPVLLPLYGSEWGRRLNARLIAVQVDLVRRRLGMGSPTCLVTVPTAVDVVHRLDHRGLVYFRFDDHASGTDVDRAFIASREDALIEESSRVLYASRGLMQEEAGRSGTKAVLLDHGVDVAHFQVVSDRAEPADLAAIPHPRVGFFGALEDRPGYDFAIITAVARALPDVQIVLIGKVEMDLGELGRMPNVHVLGWRPYAEIPAYGQFLDVGLLPISANRWGQGANPIKLKEYLALGLPVVTSRFPAAEPYDGVLRIGGDIGEIIELVRQTIADGGPATPNDRRAAVLADTWEQRARDVMAVCGDGVRS